MKIIVPKVGDVVECDNRESFGLVTYVNLANGIFRAIFISEDGSPEDEIEEFIHSITRTVTAQEAEEFKEEIENPQRYD